MNQECGVFRDRDERGMISNLITMDLPDTIKRITSNRHFNNFRGFIIGGVIAIILGYFTNYLINNSLSKEDLGLFSYYANLMRLFSPIASLSLFHAYLRFNNEKNDLARLKRKVRWGSLVSAVFLFFISYIIFNNFFISLYSFIILFNERIFFFRSGKKISRMNLLKYVSYFIIIICLVIFLRIETISYESVIAAYGLSYLGVFVIGSLIEGKQESSALQTKENIGFNTILKFSIPITLTVIVTWLARVSDQMIIKAYLPLVDLGNYAVAYRIVTVIQLFTSLFLLYYPLVYFDEAEKNNYLLINRIRNLFILILLITTIALIVTRKYVYIIMGADKYLDFTYIFTLIIIAEFLRIVAGLFLTFRAYTLENWYGTLTVGISAIISLSLNLLFIPHYGIFFAAWTQIISAFAYFVLIYFTAIRPERVFFDYAKKID
jgi:O-antigen/teichoic acid export membrane protein